MSDRCNGVSVAVGLSGPRGSPGTVTTTGLMGSDDCPGYLLYPRGRKCTKEIGRPTERGREVVPVAMGSDP